MYPVYEITNRHQMEQLGTKAKFWFLDTANNNEKKLCKIGRQNTGENWAEKVAYELAKLLGIPCAAYELATWKTQQAVITPSFVSPNGLLIHGNEQLALLTPGYDETQAFELHQYTLETVLDVWLESNALTDLPAGYKPDRDTQDAVELFLAYLLFDCWIGNQDRHDQNWGFVLEYQHKTTERRLAPSFDHASSLACRLSLAEREKRLSTKDQGYAIQGFARKANTPFYSANGKKRLKTLECFENAVVIANKQPQIKHWLQRLAAIETQQIEAILAQVPPTFGMNDITAAFTMSYLETNKQLLLGSLQ